MSSGRTIPPLDAPFNYPADEALTEVEVTDPRHPLCGRRFPLLSISSSPHAPGFALVVYRQYMRLRIPLSATDLTATVIPPSTKLTLEAVTDLVHFAKDDEVLCPLLPRRFGAGSVPPTAMPSSKSSLPSCKR
jgi:hypothetical protein